MNIDISTGHAAGHLDSLNGSRAPVQPPLRARDGLAPAVYPLGGKHRRNTECRRPQDFEVK